MSRDIAKSAANLGRQEARFLVDAYYAMQRDRISDNNQVRALEKAGEPNLVLKWLADQHETLEAQMGRALQKYVEADPVGRWSTSIVGIGPVISAALLAIIDIEKAPTAGKIWRFAGLDPTCKWEKGQKRPWNATLKVVQWKIGESFVKTQNAKNAFYGPMYVARRKIEDENNAAGKFADQARDALETKRFGEDTDAIKWYSGHYPGEAALHIQTIPAAERPTYLKSVDKGKGNGVPMLPPARIYLRAKRIPVKLFLAHWQHVAWETKFNTAPPRPFVIEHMGHVDYLAPPNWPMK